jgi:hypothetical protein
VLCIDFDRISGYGLRKIKATQKRNLTTQRIVTEKQQATFRGNFDSRREAAGI